MAVPTVSSKDAKPDPGVRQEVFVFTFMDSRMLDSSLPGSVAGASAPDWVDVVYTPRCSYKATTSVSKSLSEFSVGDAQCCWTCLRIEAQLRWCAALSCFSVVDFQNHMSNANSNTYTGGFSLSNIPLVGALFGVKATTSVTKSSKDEWDARGRDEQEQVSLFGGSGSSWSASSLCRP
jgi:hypothetical protein